MKRDLIKFIENTHKTESANALLALFTADARENTRGIHKHFNVQPTPLVKLNALAKDMGVAAFYVKDESQRGSLNAFKLLGGSHAITQILCKMTGLTPDEYFSGSAESKEKIVALGELTFAAASDGNHGRSVAYAAHFVGQHAIIYMPKGTAEDRIKNIEALGAKVVVTDGNYDDCARMITEDSEKNGWVMVPDTASEGDPQIARWVMQGYLTMASEIIEQIDAPPTHVFLQAGVGSMAATMLTALKLEYQKTLPKFYIMEPHQADCFFRSGEKGEAVSVEGDLDSIMAGLSCGVPSPDAWNLIKDYADGFFSINDILSANGMRILANPIKGDAKIISGESGAVGTGLIDYIVTQDQQTKDTLGLDENARILVISTEGDTDRKNYRNVVWYGKHSQY